MGLARIVADGCATSSGRAKTPNPQGESVTLAMHSGKLHKNWKTTQETFKT